jgi:hypothetical protein
MKNLCIVGFVTLSLNEVVNYVEGNYRGVVRVEKILRPEIKEIGHKKGFTEDDRPMNMIILLENIQFQESRRGNERRDSGYSIPSHFTRG